MRPPIMWMAVAFGAGLMAGLFASETVRGTWYVVAPVAVGATVWRKRAPLGAAVGVMGVSGLLWGGAAVAERAATCAGRWAHRQGATRAAMVRLVDPAPEGGGLVDADVIPGTCGGSLRVRWTDAQAAGGTVWVVAGRWVGDAARGTLVARRVIELDAAPGGRGALRGRIVRRVEQLFGSRAPLVDALVIARRTELDPAVRERFAQAGLAHLLVIAGLHVGFLVGWLALCLALCHIPPSCRRWLCVAALVGYVWLLGVPAPAARAAVMLLIDTIARWRQRVVAPRGLLALTALTLCVADPWAAQSVGAWLSFAAVGAVTWAARATASLPRVVRLVAPSVAATILTAPITALAFGTVAPIGVLANLVAIPVAAVTVPGLVLSLVASWIAPVAAPTLAAGSGAGLALLDLIARGAAAVPGGHVVMIAGWSAALLWAAIAVAAWWLWNAPRRRGLIAARLAFLSALIVAASFRGAFSVDECRCLTVHFLDVGQGDAAVLRTPAGRWIVIDGGPRSPQGDAGRSVVIPALRRAGAQSVAVVVSTHADADHLGGLPAVVSAFPPALVLEPGEPLGRPLYLEFLADVERSGARYRAARAGDRLTLDGVTVEVLSPDTAWMSVPVDVNDHGVVLRVSYGRTRLLFQADAGLPVEARLAGRVGRVDLLKVGHHGSHSATSEAWLDELNPREAVISVGRHNNYGHPAPEVVSRLARHGITILRTDRDGTITLTTDGNSETTNIRCQVSGDRCQR